METNIVFNIQLFWRVFGFTIHPTLLAGKNGKPSNRTFAQESFSLQTLHTKFEIDVWYILTISTSCDLHHKFSQREKISIQRWDDTLLLILIKSKRENIYPLKTMNISAIRIRATLSTTTWVWSPSELLFLTFLQFCISISCHLIFSV